MQHGTIYSCRICVCPTSAPLTTCTISVAVGYSSLKADFPKDPLIFKGDFNMELQDVQREMTTWLYPCQALAK
jgi:hypothetical protein